MNEASVTDIQTTSDIGSFAAFVLLAVIVFGGVYAYRQYQKRKGKGDK